MTALSTLVTCLSRLPGIGERTATRLAQHLSRCTETEAAELASAILAARAVTQCARCYDTAEASPCARCSDPKRDSTLLAVVAQSQDVAALDAAGFRGQYHVLGGLLSPLDGVGPEDLRIAELVDRVNCEACANTGVIEDVKCDGCFGTVAIEVFLALSASVEGDATAAYLVAQLKPYEPRLTRIATGVAHGQEIEYADPVTLRRAIEDRREIA